MSFREYFGNKPYLGVGFKARKWSNERLRGILGTENPEQLLHTVLYLVVFIVHLGQGKNIETYNQSLLIVSFRGCLMIVVLPIFSIGKMWDSRQTRGV